MNSKQQRTNKQWYINCVCKMKKPVCLDRSGVCLSSIVPPPCVGPRVHFSAARPVAVRAGLVCLRAAHSVKVACR